MLGNEKSVAGSCAVTFLDGGKNLDTTEVKIENTVYRIKSIKYKSLQDGQYYCELTYGPISKFVLDATITEGG